MGDENSKEKEELNKIIEKVEEELVTLPVEEKEERHENTKKDDDKTRQAFLEKIKVIGNIAQKENKKKQKEIDDDEER